MTDDKTERYAQHVVQQLQAEVELLRAEREAADEVSRTAQLYVAGMEEKLAKAIRLMERLLGLERGSADAAVTFIERYRADVSGSGERGK